MRTDTPPIPVALWGADGHLVDTLEWQGRLPDVVYAERSGREYAGRLVDGTHAHYFEQRRGQR